MDALHRQHQPLLADRWHELLFDPSDEGPLRVLLPVSRTVAYSISEVIPHLAFGGRLAEDAWEYVTEEAFEALDAVHAPPHFGGPLREIIDLRDEADNPHAVEVSVQRAAKRLEEKGFVEKTYVTGNSILDRTRTYVCLRLSSSEAELADAAELRAQAKQTHERHLRDGIKWIRRRGQQAVTEKGSDERRIVGYHSAATEWRDDDPVITADLKWLQWFDEL